VRKLRENEKKKGISMEELKPCLLNTCNTKRNLRLNIERGQIGKENIIKTLITREKKGGVVILSIVISIHHPLNITIGTKLQPIPRA